MDDDEATAAAAERSVTREFLAKALISAPLVNRINTKSDTGSVQFHVPARPARSPGSWTMDRLEFQGRPRCRNWTAECCASFFITTLPYRVQRSFGVQRMTILYRNARNTIRNACHSRRPAYCIRTFWKTAITITCSRYLLIRWNFSFVRRLVFFWQYSARRHNLLSP